MRRGPKLHYESLIVATGFGVNADTPGEQDASGMIDHESNNVLDWSECSLLAFIGLFYVSLA